MATYDDIATNQHILDIANGIRAITRTTEGMTIPEMPERLTSIRVVEHREVEVDLNDSSLVVSLGVYQNDLKHLFIVTPKTSADASILQRVKPEIELNYDAETGELSMGYQSPADSLVTLLVVDLLLSNDAEDAGFLITQGGGGAIEPYNPDRAYELGEMFLYNKGTEESPNYAVGITIEAHEAEEYTENHSQVLATQIREDEEYLDLKDFAERVNEQLLHLGEDIENINEELEKKIDTVNNILPDSNKNVTITGSDIKLSADTDLTMPEVFEMQGEVISAALKGKISKVNNIGTTEESADIVLDGYDIKLDKEDIDSPSLSEGLLALNESLPDITTSIIEYVNEKDNLKVDKVEGKGLSTNDYDNTEKEKLAQIQNGAQVNLLEKILVNNVEQPITDKTVNLTTPTKVSDLTDDTDVTPIKRAVADSDGNTINVTYSKVADIVNSLLSDQTAKALSAAQGKALRELIEGKELGRTYSNIEAMVESLNIEAVNTFGIAFNLLIVDTKVPDFWVAEKMGTSVPYTYTTDQALIDAIHIAPVQIGYYKISLSETAKVDLTDYVEKTLTIAGLNLEQDITKSDLQTALDFDNKVDKVAGKGLSEANFTSAEKTKLSAIQEGAQVNTITGIKGSSEGTYRVGNVNITKANIGLSDVDNTADSDKQVLSATKLTTARTIAGVSFDGTANIEVPFTNLVAKPTTLTGYGIADAMTLDTNQSVTGVKRFVYPIRLDPDDEYYNTIGTHQGYAHITATRGLRITDGNLFTPKGIYVSDVEMAPMMGSTSNYSVGTLTTPFTNGYFSNLYENGTTLSSRYVSLSGDQTITGVKTFSSTIVGNISGEAGEAAKLKGTDVRSTNEQPQWYFTKAIGFVSEFKQSSVIGLSDTYYCLLLTNVPWVDASGGLPSQVAYMSNGVIYKRSAASATTWNAWTQLIDASSAQTISGNKTLSGTTTITGTLVI